MTKFGQKAPISRHFSQGLGAKPRSDRLTPPAGLVSIPSMTNETLNAVLASVPVAPDDDGWSVPPSERHFTLYIAHDGVPLTVSKVQAVKLETELVHARTRKGEIYMVNVSDLFAIALDAPPTEGRKAGFATTR